MRFQMEQFKKPAKENGIVYAWTWNAPITKEVIDSQLEQFAQAGIEGIYILPEPIDFRPERIRTFLFPEYLSDAYMELVKYAMEKAKSVGMTLWLYDEGGWPSGGACGKTARQNPKAIETVLLSRDVELKKGENYTLAEDAIAVFDGNKRLADSFVAPADMTVIECYAGRPAEINSTRVDDSNWDVVRTFINNTYEAHYRNLGEMFGEDITLMFTDEPCVLRNVIPENFFSVFEEKYGYDVKDYLACLINPDLAVTKEQCQARIDYGKLLGELFYENFCKQLSGWCEDHRIKFGGHLNLEHRPNGGVVSAHFSHLHALRAFGVPGVDVIWDQIRYPKDGRSPLTDGSMPFFPKVAPSAAYQSGHNLALTESLGVHGEAMTHDVMRYVLNYQAIRGINVFNILMLPIDTSRLLALSERPVFTPEKPGFYNLKNFNTYYARLSYLLRLGVPMRDTALYYPASDYWANNAYSEAATKTYTDAGHDLEVKNIPFDLIDDYSILDAEDTGDGLKLGNGLYKHIVVPDCKFMPEAVAEKIRPYIGVGASLLENEPNLRVMASKIENGTLWFVFNEGEPTVKKALNINAKKLYRLDLQSGMILKAEKAEVELFCGDIAVFLETEEDIPTQSLEMEYKVEVTGFELVKARKCTLDHSGIFMHDIEISQIPEKDFSGELTYRASYSIPAGDAENLYCLTLEDTAVTAEIRIDGKKIADVGMTPMYAMVQGLPQSGIMEITVANTSANEIVAKQDVINEFPKAEIGPYNKISLPFEENAPEIRFGKVTIEKVKR